MEFNEELNKELSRNRDEGGYRTMIETIRKVASHRFLETSKNKNIMPMDRKHH